MPNLNQKQHHKLAFFKFGLVFLTVLILDQLTKFKVGVADQLNFGVAFGLQLPRIEFLLVGLLVGLVLYFRLAVVRLPIAMGLFFGGAVSNLIDRLLMGGVRDFLVLPVFNLTNNLADWAVVIGLSWYLVATYRKAR